MNAIEKLERSIASLKELIPLSEPDDAAVILRQDGDIEIFPANGGLIIATPNDGDAGPFAG